MYQSDIHKFNFFFYFLGGWALKLASVIGRVGPLAVKRQPWFVVHG